MTWEYCTCIDEKMLVNLGRQGWELVNVLAEDGIATFYLKRPVDDLRSRVTEEQRLKVYKYIEVRDHL